MNQPPVRHTYIWLDLIRALAALAVFMQHLRTLLFKNYWMGQTSSLKKIFYFVTGFSHEAVIVFFVLSGFFITGAIVRAWEKGKFSFLNYGIDRLIRLWIVLIPGLIFTLIVDRMGLYWFGTNPAYTGAILYTGHIDVASNLSAASFFGNIFFLQGILVNTFGSNSPLWSLSNEFWYYVLFPVLFFIFYYKKAGTRVLLLILALGIFVFIGKDMLMYFLIWLLGSVLFFVKKTFETPAIWVRNALFIGGSLALALYFYKLRTGGGLDWEKDLMSGVITAVLCYAGLFATIHNKMISKIISFFSGISYSLYIIHLPLCIFITSLVVGSQKDWGLKYLLLYFLIAVIILGVTVIFWYCFESRYIQVRTYFKKKFFSGAPAINMN